MTKFLLTILLTAVIGFGAHAQGCVAIRGFSGCASGMGNTFGTSKGEFISSANFRYFKSFRHFRGTHEETNRVADGTEVINKSYFLDLSLTYGITDRLYGTVTLPFLYHDRSSMYEHGGNPPNGLGERHTTRSSGLADIRIGAGYWLIDPTAGKKFNYAVGLGLKLPTGDYNYTDTFYNQGRDRNIDREAVVDQSIQPGDGGTGITVDVQGFHVLSAHFVLSTNLFYMVSPQETNGVMTRSTNNPSEFSCPDQFAVRVGTFYNSPIQGLSAYFGGRLEGVPAEDLVGGSAGYRRPGHALSLEPGFVLSKNNLALNVSVPLAVARNRTRSYQDKVRTRETGVYRHGDAAFADYLLNFTLTYRFGGHHKSMMMDHVPQKLDFNESK